MTIPTRIKFFNKAHVNPNGKYVLYWMTSYRRPFYNYSIDYAVAHAKSLDLPLVVFEGLRTCYPWSSERLHRFVIEGMQNQQEHFKKNKINYLPYVEPEKDAGKGLLAKIATDAAMLVLSLIHI